MTGSVEGILNTSLECENEGKYQRLKNNSVAILLSVLINRCQKLYWISLITIY